MTKVYFEDSVNLNMDRAVKLLAGIPDGVYRAVGSALKRAAQRGLTAGMKIVAGEYAIGQNELKARTENINAITHSGPGTYEVRFGYRGNVIPLINFDTRVDGSGRVSTRVLRSSAREALDDAFIAHMGEHQGVFERLGPDRFPVRELFGPSAVQAFYAHKETVDLMDEEVRKAYDARIEHEITRVLNGW